MTAQSRLTRIKRELRLLRGAPPGRRFTRRHNRMLARDRPLWLRVARILGSGMVAVAGVTLLALPGPGLLVVILGLAMLGVKRALAPKAGGVSGALMLYGLSMVAAELFPADPVDGFPVGTPLGMPTALSTRGMLHFVFGALAFTSLGVAGLLAARRFWQPARGLATLSLGAGLLVLLGFFGGFMIPGIGTLGIWASVVVGWGWLMALSLQLQRVPA